MIDYRKLKVWEKSHELVLKTYQMTANLPVDEKYNITSQIKRAVVSIPLNIAEGSGKFSDLDKARFYQIALGSTHEVEYLFLLIADLRMISENVLVNLRSEIGEIKAMLIALIKKLRVKPL